MARIPRHLFAVLALGVLEGVLPLHFAERLTQAEIARLYVGVPIVVAVNAANAAAAGTLRPARWSSVPCSSRSPESRLAGGTEEVPICCSP